MNRAEDLFKALIDNGESAIDELIQTRKSEELFLDFKRSADQGAGPRLHTTDSNNFAKAISGFGNSEGGVIVWGIECSKDRDGADVASTKFALEDAAAFVSRLEGAVSRCTVPPHSGVRSVAISSKTGKNGFAISFIPKSNSAPHQTIPDLKYFMRAGSDFVPVPHAVLAGMFGRRPAPRLGPMYVFSCPTIESLAICFEVGIVLRNEGPGIARDVFLTLMGKSMPGKGSLAFQSHDLENWIVTKTLGVHMSFFLQAGVTTRSRLPSDACDSAI